MTTLPAARRPAIVPDRRRRMLILAICSMSLLVIGLDATIVNVALPAIQRSFHATLPGLQWTVDAYTLVLASLLLLAGSTADRLGRRRVLQAGLATFLLGSLEMRFFASAPFAGASAIAVCLSAALGGFLFMSTLYLQDVRGLSPLRAGLCMLPVATMMIVVAPLSGRLVGRCGARPSMAAGGVAVSASGLMLTGLAPDTSVSFLLGAYAVFGCGFALVSPPIANTAVSGMPPAQAGVAAAVATTSRQVGLTLVDRGRAGARSRCARLRDDVGSGAAHRAAHGGSARVARSRASCAETIERR